jgi:formylglycine-generating enzyme required for sulfatase activity
MRRPATLVGLAIALTFVAATLLRARDVRGDAPPTPSAGAECPPGMVLVPGGTVPLGAADDPDALPPGPRTIAPFCIDRLEVTVARYQACVSTGRCSGAERTISFPGYGPPEPMRTELSRYCNAYSPDHGEYPMNCVDAAAAAAFCAAEGGRLPDEEEWEYAARGPSGARFPWGPRAPGRAGETAPLCWDRRATGLGTCAVGQSPAGASRFGALDMAGNVWEWTSSRTADGSIVRGGGWTNFLPRLVSTTYRWPLARETRLHCLGFRCVRPVPGSPEPP